MSTDISKKRKRDSNLQDDNPIPRKSRVVGDNAVTRESTPNAADNAIEKTNLNGANNSLGKKSKGAARQAKSERRSKKANKTQKLTSQVDGEGSASISNTMTPHGGSEKTEDQKSIPFRKAKRPKPFKSSHTKQREAILAGKLVKKQFMKEEAQRPNDEQGQRRYILFVGNLPFSATTSDIEAQFSKYPPVSIRHSTEKETGRSKGFAFIEYQSSVEMRKSLQHHHRSVWRPDAILEEVSMPPDDTGKKPKKPPKKGRKINVELTVGGGGNSNTRKTKILSKNKKIAEERNKRRQQESTIRAKARKAQDQQNGDSTAEGLAQQDRGAIHPDRLNRVSH